MSGANCMTCSGEYGEFQLVDPLDRRPDGHVTISILGPSIKFYFAFLKNELTPQREYSFKRDLVNLIGMQIPELAGLLYSVSGNALSTVEIYSA